MRHLQHHICRATILITARAYTHTHTHTHTVHQQTPRYLHDTEKRSHSCSCYAYALYTMFNVYDMLRHLMTTTTSGFSQSRLVFEARSKSDVWCMFCRPDARTTNNINAERPTLWLLIVNLALVSSKVSKQYRLTSYRHGYCSYSNRLWITITKLAPVISSDSILTNMLPCPGAATWQTWQKSRYWFCPTGPIIRRHGIIHKTSST